MHTVFDRKCNYIWRRGAGGRAHKSRQHFTLSPSQQSPFNLRLKAGNSFFHFALLLLACVRVLECVCECVSVGVCVCESVT